VRIVEGLTLGRSGPSPSGISFGADQISAMSFVGSSPIARYVCAMAASEGMRVQAFGGAKNHMVIMPDADMDKAPTR
jgi:acyl-CoA reductase-like NAD-dependent aldehyde dehydrogenase